MNILIIGAYPNSIVGFRGQLIQSWVKEGHKVTVMSADAEAEVIEKVCLLGANFRPYKVQRNGLNPLSDLQTLFELYRAIKACKPDKILAYTIKPIIWGGIAARFYKKSDFYAMVTGLGYAFEKGSFKRSIVNVIAKGLYRYSLKRVTGVIFQNTDNLQTFVDQKLVKKEKTHRIFGSGVDLAEYSQTPLPAGAPVFLLVARLLGDKGIREYAEAAFNVKKQYPDTRFQLLGPEDSSPDGICAEELAQWTKTGTIEYLGVTNHVLPFVQQCHIYTLPSYHEGLPRSVLEAMSVGRPILTTTASGCRDTVLNERNGKLVSPKDSQQLEDQILWFIENRDAWENMADESRAIAEDIFDVHKVNRHINSIIFQ